jgi:tRNA A-37 threonylcarbamoyl transferase component Bud32
MQKSSGTAALLGFFGPLGLLYVGQFWVSFIVFVILGIVTSGASYFVMPFVCAFWGWAVCNNQLEEQKRAAKKQLNAALQAEIDATSQRNLAAARATAITHVPKFPAPAEIPLAQRWDKPQKRITEATVQVVERVAPPLSGVAAIYTPAVPIPAPAPVRPALISNPEEAQHLANKIVSDVELYARDQLVAAAESGAEPTFAITTELAEAKAQFSALVAPDLGTTQLHFQRAVRDIIVSKHGPKNRTPTSPPPPTNPSRVSSTGTRTNAIVDELSSLDDLQPGTQLDGRYEVVSLLGRGAMAAVYKVRHLGLHSVHALKVLNTALARNEDLSTRFISEGRIQAQIRHPNIVAVTEIVTSPVAGLVLEFVEGPTLDRYVAGIGRALKPAEIREVMLPVLEAVETAHGRGVIHRDLKPENIIVGRDSSGRVQPKVTDFGIAKLVDGGDLRGTKRKTQANTRMGTLIYMSPEQVRGASLVDARSDVFSLGAIVYELATGRCAFEHDSEFDTMTAIVTGKYEPPERIASGLPPALAYCIHMALQVEPAARFQSCAAFHQTLASIGA